MYDEEKEFYKILISTLKKNIYKIEYKFDIL